MLTEIQKRTRYLKRYNGQPLKKKTAQKFESYQIYMTFYFLASDTNLLCYSDNCSELEKFANTELTNIENFMNANKLSLNTNKTVYTIFLPKKGPYKNKDQEISIKIGNQKLQFVNEIKFLGLTTDRNLRFNTHFNKVIKKMKSGIGALNLIKHTFPIKTKLLIYNSLIKPHYEYVNIIWFTNLNKKQTNEIIKLQK